MESLPAKWGAGCIIVSPLRRTVETAALMLHEIAGEVPVLISHHAREQWWSNIENVGLTPYPETIDQVSGCLRDRFDPAVLEGLNR